MSRHGFTTTVRMEQADEHGASQRLKRIADAIEALAPTNEFTQTPISPLSVYAWRMAAAHTHLVYRPSLCVVVQGSKRARVGQRIYRYDSARFFFTAIPLPAKLEVKRARGGPLVGMVLELDLEQLARVALEVDDALQRIGAPGAPTGVPNATFTGRMRASLLDALERLIGMASDPVRREVLASSALRAVVFELLLGPEGTALRKALSGPAGLRTLIEVGRFIDEHSHQPMRVPNLARRAGMSQSAFFTKFRQLTGATPLQYVKHLRLTKARVLLSMGSNSVTEAAHAVGYSSSAHFSRDFREAFGLSPSQVGGRR